MLIENVDWQITARCNRTCPYCFGPSAILDLSYAEVQKIVDILAANGIHQIGLTGGEPLLYPHISELIEYISHKGISIYLSSNCDYYASFSELIKRHVSILGVPLDGATPDIHNSLRGKNSFTSIMNAIQDITSSNCKTQIKIGTVLTGANKSDLANIENLLSIYSNKLIFWKIYELISYSRNLESVEPLRTDFVVKTDQLGKYIDAKKIVVDSVNERDRSYFFLKPNGDVFIPQLSHHVSSEQLIGNILKDDFGCLSDIFIKNANCKGYHSAFRYMKNDRRAYYNGE